MGTGNTKIKIVTVLHISNYSIIWVYIYYIYNKKIKGELKKIGYKFSNSKGSKLYRLCTTKDYKKFKKEIDGLLTQFNLKKEE